MIGIYLIPDSEVHITLVKITTNLISLRSCQRYTASTFSGRFSIHLYLYVLHSLFVEVWRIIIFLHEQSWNVLLSLYFG